MQIQHEYLIVLTDKRESPKIEPIIYRKQMKSGSKSRKKNNSIASGYISQMENFNLDLYFATYDKGRLRLDAKRARFFR